MKNRLAEYVRHVRAGEAILVTDRGEVVAELAPPGRAQPDDTMPPGVRELARRGALTVGQRNDPSAYPALAPVLGEGRAAALLDAERGPR